MEIDVIIPLYKPGKELFTLLDKLGSQSVPVHQVILLNTEEKYFEQLIYGIRFLETIRMSRYTMYPKESSIMAVRDGWE